MSVESVSSVVRFVRVVLHVRLFDDGVLVIVRVILGVLVRLRDMVVEGRECRGIWAAHVWPEPPVSHWLLILEDWIALVNEGRGICILVAHLDDDLTVNVFLVVQVGVSLFKRV